MLGQAINDYLSWMISKGYSESYWEMNERAMRHFYTFIKERNIAWEMIFTHNTLQAFQEERGKTYTFAARGFWRYLYGQGRISQPLQKEKPRLPNVSLLFDFVCKKSIIRF
jgi:hypothetical protein